MNVIQAAKMYINQMIKDCGPGMKILLMDKETTSITSMVYSQSEILLQEVYLLERLDAENRESDGDNALQYLKCIIFVRPTEKNIRLLGRELRNPSYSAYYIYFSNILTKAALKTLAECDEQEVVQEIKEYYADFLAVSPHLFSLGIQTPIVGDSWHEFSRTVQGLTSVLLSLKKLPTIRYQSNSELCKKLAESIHEVTVKESELFQFRQNDIPLLLILDRRDDPVTPLLNQWTYQAMVHELLTISNNRVSLAHVPGISKELREVVLSAEQDEFYAENLYKNFGEIGIVIKSLMEEFQSKAKKQQKVESISDMKQFIETYPQFKKMSGTVSKHVTVVAELSNMVAKHDLLKVWEVEEEIVSQYEHSKHLQEVKQLVKSQSIRDIDAARLVMLYLLRYEKHANVDKHGLFAALIARKCPENLIQAARYIVKYGGSDVRQCNLFGSNDAVQYTKKLFKGLRGLDNVYTQHKPVLHDLLEELSKGKLRETSYPYVNPDDSDGQSFRRHYDVIIFIVGGVTYKEALTVYNFNKNSNGTQVVIGGTDIHNTSSFLVDMDAAVHSAARQ